MGIVNLAAFGSVGAIRINVARPATRGTLERLPTHKARPGYQFFYANKWLFDVRIPRKSGHSARIGPMGRQRPKAVNDLAESKHFHTVDDGNDYV